MLGPATWLVALLPFAVGQDDALGLGNGYLSFKTRNFDIQLGSDSQILASLKPSGGSFDFLPFDYLNRRARNGQYHWGDITYRYRKAGSSSGAWTGGDSSAARKPVTGTRSAGSDVLAGALLGPTLPSGAPLNVTREWIDVDGDLGLQFTIFNAGTDDLEIGSLGFPAEFNSIFTDRSAEDIQAKCSLSDPYIGMDAGYIRVASVSGVGPALVVTPIADTPLEAYRNLVEGSYAGTYYGSQTFEGFYEWQVLSKAWAEKEWKSSQPWNPPSSRNIRKGESIKFGLRFSLARDGVRGIDKAVQDTGTPVAVGVPGYIIPQDGHAQLLLRSDIQVAAITSDPVSALTATQISPGLFQINPSPSAWGRARLTITYSDRRTQTVHYFITKPATQALSDLGHFLTTSQYFTDVSDPFGRAPSVLTYDHDVGQIVTQDNRVWIAGLSDEGGAGSFLAAAMKQAALPSADEIAKLEAFVDGVLWKTIQTSDYAVRKSIFFYEPSVVSGYSYRDDMDWTGWWSWNRQNAYAIDRAYDYVHVTATYWALYRVARAYPDLTKAHAWDWYLNQAYQTVMRCMQTDSQGNLIVGYATEGLMGETVFGELLADLKREGQNDKADALSSKMRKRADRWKGMAVPFGSEMAWDSTGQEGVYYWANYFGDTSTASKAVGTVLGFSPTVAHWGWNGNARRYWDNVYGGKLRRIERQIHHYGSGLNALVALSAYRSNPSDSYLLRIGYGGMNGPLSNIHDDGFAAASFHSWPETLQWDGYSGDYGPGFLGLVLGSATYLVDDAELGGLAAYGGILTGTEGEVKVVTTDAVRRKIFVGPLALTVSVDAGIIQEFTYNASSKSVKVTLSQLSSAPKAKSAIVWVEGNFAVRTQGLKQSRQGWEVPLGGSPAEIDIGPS